MSRSRELPRAVSLPSGRRVLLDDREARARAATSTGSLVARAVSVLRSPGVVRDPTDTAFSAGDLSLRDGHVLRALLGWADVLEEPVVTFPCDNCGSPLEVVPSRALEIAPFVDGELDDPELDRPFDFRRARRLPRSGAKPVEVRLAPRTLAEAEALLLRDPERPLRVTSAIVSAMGLASLDGERRLSRLARSVGRMDDRAWDALTDLYDEAHYAPRLFGTVRCACGAIQRVSAPHAHELLGGPTERGGDASPPVSLDAFEAMADRIAREVLARRGTRDLSVIVDDGVPPCDDGGEPLLGSYLPARVDPDSLVESPPEVSLFYRTFAAETSRGDFDLEAEVKETIEHEVQHHLFALSGDDPMDAEERREIEREERAIVGRRELGRRDARRQRGDFVAFVRATWPFFLFGALALGLRYCV